MSGQDREAEEILSEKDYVVGEFIFMKIFNFCSFVLNIIIQSGRVRYYWKGCNRLIR